MWVPLKSEIGKYVRSSGNDVAKLNNFKEERLLTVFQRNYQNQLDDIYWQKDLGSWIEEFGMQFEMQF